MYERFYGLTAKPFSVIPDPRFIYWASQHALAFSMLEYGIISHAGFTVITGEVGAGKTTLIRYLISRLPPNVSVGLLNTTQRGRGELLEWVLMAFGRPFEGLSYVSLHKCFQDFLLSQNVAGKRTVLIIDEAQNLGVHELEELRLISNANTFDQELLQIVLSGQPELKNLLGGPEMRQFVQRVTSDFHLTLLKSDEVMGYIDHRLSVAGAPRVLFTQEACALVAEATGGTPRLINILCDTALVYGFASGSAVVDEPIVRKVLEQKREHGVFAFGSDFTSSHGE